MSFSSYVKKMCIYVLSSSLVLGFVLGVALLIMGGTTMNVDGDLEFGVFDGFWLVLVVPAASILVFVFLSPLSFWIHKLMSK